MNSWNGPVTTGSRVVRYEDTPGGHAACDAQIAALRRVIEIYEERLPAIRDALRVAEAEAEYAHQRLRYREVLETIADYGEPGHNEPPEVRYVSSSDSAASGEEIPKS